MQEATAWQTHPWVAEGEETIRFGVGVTTRATLAGWDIRLQLVRALEQLGFDSYWVPDHPAFLPDCWTTLAALATTTNRIRLGTLVSCIYYRSPLLLARHAADVDRLSAGRLVLGLGIGWYEPEFKRLNLPYPPVPERQQTLEGTIQIIRGLWTGDPYTYHGNHHHLDEAQMLAGPVQLPHIPLLIGGNGEQVTLRQVAQFADMSNFDAGAGEGLTTADVHRKLAVIQRYCDRQGRPFASALSSHFVNPVIMAETTGRVQEKLNALTGPYWVRPGLLAGTPSEVIAFYRPLIQAGIRYFIGNLCRYDDLETVQLLAEKVLPELQAG